MVGSRKCESLLFNPRPDHSPVPTKHFWAVDGGPSHEDILVNVDGDNLMGADFPQDVVKDFQNGPGASDPLRLRAHIAVNEDGMNCGCCANRALATIIGRP